MAELKIPMGVLVLVGVVLLVVGMNAGWFGGNAANTNPSDGTTNVPSTLGVTVTLNTRDVLSPTGANVKGTDIINPDNLCVTENFVYIQEDGDSYFPEATHNSLIWQYNIANGTKKVFMDMTHKDAAMLNSKYNPASTNQNKFGIWEHGAMEDISDVIGVPGTFTINIHAHTWVEGDKFLNPSKATSIQAYKSGGQTLLITNVPR